MDRSRYLKGIFQKAWQVADAYASRGFLGTRVEKEIREIRDISCHGSEELNIPPCPARRISDKFQKSYICDDCNCGDFRDTQLMNLNEKHYSKLDYPRAYCPREMPGFSNYVPLKIYGEDMRKHLIEETFGVDYLSDAEEDEK
jgi:hypothetical protein